MDVEKRIPERTAVLETNDRNIFHQLTEIKTELRSLPQLSVLCEGISAKLTTISEKIGALEKRVSELERSPAEDLRHYRRTAIAALITGMISLLVGFAAAIFNNL